MMTIRTWSSRLGLALCMAAPCMAAPLERRLARGVEGEGAGPDVPGAPVGRDEDAAWRRDRAGQPEGGRPCAAAEQPLPRAERERETAKSHAGRRA